MFEPTEKYIALYSQEDHSAQMVVRAFNQDGYAMVLDSDQGRLIRARDITGFNRVVQDDKSDIIAVLPGQDWRVLYGDADDPVRVPVVGWAVDRQGWAQPMLPDIESGTLNVHQADNFLRLHHRDL